MLTIARKELLSLLEPADRVAPTRTVKEVLLWIRVTHDGHLLTVEAWDGEVGIKLRREHAGEPCDFLLPARRAVAVLKAFVSENVTLRPQADGTHCTGIGERFRFPSRDTAEFPAWDHKGDEFALTSAVFGPAIQRVRCAVSEGDPRYAFSGIYLDMTEGMLVATNSRVLCAELLGVTDDVSGVLPLKMANIAANTLIGDFRVRMSAGAAEFDDGHTCVFGRLVQGRFPAWRSVMESECECELDITAGELLRVAKQAMLASDVERQSIDLALGRGTLTASSGSADRGDSSVQIPIASDAACKVTFDGTFLVGMLSALDPLETVHWRVSSHGANQFALRNWTGVVMPMAAR